MCFRSQSFHKENISKIHNNSPTSEQNDHDLQVQANEYERHLEKQQNFTSINECWAMQMASYKHGSGIRRMMAKLINISKKEGGV